MRPRPWRGFWAGILTAVLIPCVAIVLWPPLAGGAPLGPVTDYLAALLFAVFVGLIFALPVILVGALAVHSVTSARARLHWGHGPALGAGLAVCVAAPVLGLVVEGLSGLLARGLIELLVLLAAYAVWGGVAGLAGWGAAFGLRRQIDLAAALAPGSDQE